ncbi:MAG TPA: MFS transporter [Myxococcales bacterium]|nr:MFS transporter [Myxococcales bacterium]
MPELGRPYFLLLLASLLSDIGSFITQTAVTLYVYRLSGQSAVSLGLSTLANLLPYGVASPLGGVCAERYSRKWVMVANDAIRLPLTLLLAVTTNLWGIYGLQACVSASTAVFTPSRQSIIPDLVPERHLNLANSVSGGALSLVHVLGPVMGAALFIAGDGLRWAVLVDAASYAASALLLLPIPSARRPAAEKREGVVAEVVAGLRYARGAPDLMQILVLSLAAGTAVGILLPLLRPFVTEALGGNDATYAQLIGAFGLGGLVGPFVAFLAARRLGPGKVVLLGCLAEASLMLTWTRIGHPAWSCAVLFVWGVVIFAVIPNQQTYLQTYVDRDYLGRAFALLDQSTMLPQVLGAGVVALIGGRLSSPLIITGAAVMYLVVAALVVPTRGGRLLRSRRPAPEGAEAT